MPGPHTGSDSKTELEALPVNFTQRRNEPTLTALQTIKASPRAQKWTKTLAHFLSGQIVIQVLNFLTGFLLLRWLSVTAYAEFSVAFAFQSTLGMLIDLGFSNSIVALVGDRGSDSAVVGKYIRSARYFRNRMFAVMLCISVVAFPLMTQHQHWSTMTKLLLFGAIVSSVFFQGWGMYAAPLLINGRVKEYYQSQVFSAAGRLFCCFVLFKAAALSAWTTAWVAAGALALTGFLYRKKCLNLVHEPRESDPVFNKEMLLYLSPLIPGVIFTALQGQISIALITIFGRSTNIAEVAALGRLGQLFLVFAAFNSVIVEPHVAQVAPKRLVNKYLLIACCASSLAIVLAALGFLFPVPFLWLLGKKYSYLQSEVGWIVSGACVNYVAGVLWVMNSARKWLFWWYTNMYIACVLLTQVICISIMRLNTTHSVIILSFITAVVVLCTHIIGGAYGLIKQNSFRYSISLNEIS